MSTNKKRFGINLKVLRTKAKVNQANLAEYLNTPRENITAWETSKAEPPEIAVHDLALFFGLTSQELLNVDCSKAEPRTNPSRLVESKTSEELWGHIGLDLHGGKGTLWYPISFDEYKRVGTLLLNMEKDGWIAVDTLSNRALAIRPSALKRISLLDFDSEVPDWNTDFFDIEGLEPECYNALYDYCCAPKDFKENYSERFQKFVTEYLEKHNIMNGDRQERFLTELNETRIYNSQGEIHRFDPDPYMLHNVIRYLDAEVTPEEKLVRLNDQDGLTTVFYPKASLVLIDASLLSYIEGYAQTWRDELDVPDEVEDNSKPSSE